MGGDFGLDETTGDATSCVVLLDASGRATFSDRVRYTIEGFGEEEAADQIGRSHGLRMREAAGEGIRLEENRELSVA